MEQLSANTEKRTQQIGIFNEYSVPLVAGDELGEHVLTYDNFVNLISDSRKRLTSKPTDHLFNLNRVPYNSFGCIFFALDTQNKGYLTLSDWFHFNNILEHEHYNLILLFEFFRKFDNGRVYSATTGNTGTGARIPPDRAINYSRRDLNFDNLLLNVEQFRSAVKLLENSVKDPLIKNNWDSLDFSGFSQIPNPFYSVQNLGVNRAQGRQQDFDSLISVNSLITLTQTDFSNRRTQEAYKQYSHLDETRQNMTLDAGEMIDLLKAQYGHRIPMGVFDSLSFSSTDLAYPDRFNPSYSVYRDLTYLFEHFDLLNELLTRDEIMRGQPLEKFRAKPITREEFMNLFVGDHAKVANITQFTPAQLNLLYTIVKNLRKLDRLRDLSRSDEQRVKKLYHQEPSINKFLQDEYTKDTVGLTLFDETFRDKSSELIKAITSRSSLVTDYRGSSPLDQFQRQQNVPEGIGQRNHTGQTSDSFIMNDFLKVVNPNYLNELVHELEMKKIEEHSLFANHALYPLFDSIYNLVLGSVAGSIGCWAVYPIDFVKTRMQAQRHHTLYTGYMDCVKKVVKLDGIRGLYAGLGFQLLGVAPEKAVSLTANSYMRKWLVDKHGHLSIMGEIISGAVAGSVQIIFTNPVELVKVRLQVLSEQKILAGPGAPQVTSLDIVRKLTLKELYKGTSACFWRDMPFSAIYFPTYAHVKRDVLGFDPSDPTKKNKLPTAELLVAGAVAGMPAAYLTTPFDVLKTRLQVIPREGETRYTGLLHAARTILREEGWTSFFKGGVARIFRCSPQFGFTLASYELFRQWVAPPTVRLAHRNEEKLHSTANPLKVSFFERIIEALPGHSNRELVERHAIAHKNDIFNPSIDPYGGNYLSYYHKSCEVAKTFIDVDCNFAKFDRNVYDKFFDYTNRLRGGGGEGRH